MRTRRSRLLQERVAESVIVTLRSGDSFSGVLWDVDDKLWVLRNAQALGAGKDGAALPLDGEVIVLTAEILYCQRP